MIPLEVGQGGGWIYILPEKLGGVGGKLSRSSNYGF